MKYLSGLFILLITLSCSPAVSPRATPHQPAESVAPGNMEGSIVNLVNDYRRSKGLGSLQVLEVANEQATGHSRNMASGRTAFSHNGFDERVANIKKSVSPAFLSGWAENVAMGQMSAKEVVKGWLNSSGHRKNIEGNYNFTGVGIAKDKNGDLYFTQIFVKK